MRVREIIVSYGQTVPGDRQFESERFDMSVKLEPETDEEKSVKNLRANLDKLGKRVQEAVEEKSGRKMGRKRKKESKE